MSKRISIVLLICIFFSAYVFGSDNLVLNGGYEDWVDGLPEHFIKVGTVGIVEAVEDDAKSGSFSVKISHAQMGTTYVYQLVDVEPETNYLLTVWLKGENINSSTFGGQVRIYDQGGNKLIYEGQPLVGTFGWREYKMLFNSGSHSAFRFMAPMLTNVRSGAIYADDLSIRPLAIDDLDISIEPQIIPADGETSSVVEISCSNLFSSGLLFRVAGVQMLDTNNDEIEEIQFNNETGKASFKITGTTAGDYPIEFSSDGGTTWFPLNGFPQVKIVSTRN